MPTLPCRFFILHSFTQCYATTPEGQHCRAVIFCAATTSTALHHTSVIINTSITINQAPCHQQLHLQPEHDIILDHLGHKQLCGRPKIDIICALTSSQTRHVTALGPIISNATSFQDLPFHARHYFNIEIISTPGLTSFPARHHLVCFLDNCRLWLDLDIISSPTSFQD